MFNDYTYANLYPSGRMSSCSNRKIVTSEAGGAGAASTAAMNNANTMAVFILCVCGLRTVMYSCKRLIEL
jgi:hypothetical protein